MLRIDRIVLVLDGPAPGQARTTFAEELATEIARAQPLPVPGGRLRVAVPAVPHADLPVRTARAIRRAARGRAEP